MKRARFRADSTPYDDKLASCEYLRCYKLPLSSLRATYSGVNKRRRELIEDADNEDILSSGDGSAPSDASPNSMAVDENTPSRKPKRSCKRSRRSKKPSNAEAMDVYSTVAPKAAPVESQKSAATPGTRSKPTTPLVSSFTPPSPSAEDNLQPQMVPLRRAVVEITTATDGSPRLGMYVVVNDNNIPTH